MHSTLGALEVIKPTYLFGGMKEFEYVMGSVVWDYSTQVLWAYPNRKHWGRGQLILDWAYLNCSNILIMFQARTHYFRCKNYSSLHVCFLFPFSCSSPFPVYTPASAGNIFQSSGNSPYVSATIPDILVGSLSRSQRASCLWPLWSHLVPNPALSLLSLPWAGVPLALCLKYRRERHLFKLVGWSSDSGSLPLL